MDTKLFVSIQLKFQNAGCKEKDMSELYSRQGIIIRPLLEVDESPFFRCVHSIEDNGDMKIKRRSYTQTLAIVAQGVTVENISVQTLF